MAAAGDDEVVAVVDDRTRIVALGGEVGESARHVEACERLRAFLDRRGLRNHACRQPLENLQLQPERAVGGAGDLGFQLAQFAAGEAHLAGQRLAVDEGGVERGGRELVAMLGGNLDEIAEHVVVADFQAAHAGFFGVARLQGGDHAARLVAQRARFVQARVVAFAHKAAVTLERGEFRGKRARQFGGQHAVGAAAGLQRAGDVGRHILERRQSAGEVGGRQHAVADGGEIARSAAVNGQASQRTRQIGRRLQPRARIGARRNVIDEACDTIEPPPDGLGIGERRRQSLRQQARAGRGDRAVDRVQQRAAPLARKRAHQFEIAAGGLVDRDGCARAFAQRRRQRRAFADLRALDVGDAGRGGGQLQPRERAEGFAGRHREERGQPPLGAGAIEHVAGERRHRRQRAPIRHEVGVGKQSVRHDDLARLQPRDLGRQR